MEHDLIKKYMWRVSGVECKAWSVDIPTNFLNSLPHATSNDN